MTPKETVLALYSAYAAGDSRQISGLLDEDVVWVAPAGNATQVALGLGNPKDAGAPRGANNLKHDEIVEFMTYNFGSLLSGREERVSVHDCGGEFGYHRA